MNRTMTAALIAVVLAMGFVTTPAKAQSFKLDPPHCWLVYQIRHFDMVDAYGQFTAPSGTITLDDDPSKVSIQIQAKVDNVDSGNPQRDTHLKSPDFFDSKQFPNISFTSKSVKKAGENLEVTGDFTMHGVTKSVTVTFKTRQANTAAGYRAGLETTLSIKRSDYGMAAYTNMVADEVKLIIGVEGVRQQGFMPDPIEFLLVPCLIAAGVALAVLVVFWRRPEIGAPIALAAGALAPFQRIAGALPSIPPLDSKGWVFCLTIVAALVALTLVLTKAPLWSQAIATVVLVVAGNTVVLRHRLIDPDVMTSAIAWTAGMLVTAIVWWTAFAVDQPATRRIISPAMLLLAIFSAIRLLMSSATLYGRLGVAFCGAVALLALLGAVRPGLMSRSTAIVFVAFLTNLLLAGIFDADLGHYDVILICVAPGLMVLAGWGVGKRTPSWWMAAISLSLLILPLVAVVAIRLPAFLRLMQVDRNGYSY